MGEGEHKWRERVFLFFSRDESELLCCSLLTLSHAASAVFHKLLPLLSKSVCFEMTYLHSETLSARVCVCVCVWCVCVCVCVRERHTHREREFVVSRAFSLAPEALAKSAVRFGSLLSTLHI